MCFMMVTLITEILEQMDTSNSNEMCRRNMIREPNIVEICSIGGINLEQFIYDEIVLGEARDYMKLHLLCQNHAAPCRKCVSSRIRHHEKPVHGQIAQRLTNNNIAVPYGFNTYEIQYEVILKRPEILHSMYPLEEAMER